MRMTCGTILAAAMAAMVAMAQCKVVNGVAYADSPECRLDVRVPVGETNFGVPRPNSQQRKQYQAINTADE